MSRRWLRLIFGGLVAASSLLVASATLLLPQAAQASACNSSNWGISGSSTSDAGLVIHTQLSNGTEVNVALTLYDTDSTNKYSIWYAPGGFNTSVHSSWTGSTGGTYYAGSDSCNSTGYAVFGYGSTTDQGNKYALDCKQVTSGGGYTTVTSHFNIKNIANPAGHPNGSWNNLSDFTVTNGGTRTVTLTWTDAPQYATLSGVKERYYHDSNGDHLNNGDGAITGLNVNVATSNGPDNSQGFNIGSINDGTRKTTIAAPPAGWFVYGYTICDKASASCNTSWVDNPSNVNKLNGALSFDKDYKGGHDYLMRWFIYPPATLSGSKITYPSGATNGAINGLNVKMDNAAVTAANSTSNPFSFNKVENSGGTNGGSTYTISSAAAPAGWKIYGYTICDDGTPTDGNASCSNAWVTNTANITKNGTGSFTYTIKPYHTYLMRWWYQLSTDGAVCTAISANPAGSLNVGQSFTVTMSFKNTGTSTWTTASGYKAVSSGTIGPANLTMSPSTVAPNSQSSFSFTTSAPTAGSKTVTYNMANGSGAFGSSCTLTLTITGTPGIAHKIFGANAVDILSTTVRDNYNFAFNLGAYFWPDAGCKNTCSSSSSTPNLWLAGSYRNTGVSGDSTNTDINRIGRNFNFLGKLTINDQAETGCPTGACLQRVPLAYVPQSSGSAASSGGADLGSTPNGNNWLSIFNRSFNQSYDTYRGGVASPVSNCSAQPVFTDPAVGFDCGPFLNNVEVSNIRVSLSGIQTTATSADKGQSYQGDLPLDGIQPSDQPPAPAGQSLVGGSQGPLNACSGTCSGTWDNIRNPNSSFVSSGYSASVNSNIDFTNSSGSPANFTADPTSFSSVQSVIAKQVYGSGTATSLLQDGHGTGPGNTYNSTSEPLSLTGSVTSANTALKWDEYDDWSQVDDKGHWATTRGQVYTGINRGSLASSSIPTYGYYSGYSTWDGTYTTYCTNWVWNIFTLTWTCTATASYPNYTSCYTYAVPTSWYYTYNNITYYDPHSGNSDGKFGWINPTSYQSAVTDGSYRGMGSSYFGWSPSRNPAWASLPAPIPYWQDDSVTTSMALPGAESGATTPYGSHAMAWHLDQTDAAYNGRTIFSSPDTPFFQNGWQYSYSYPCIYPNGYTYYSGSSTAFYYPYAQGLYEGSGLPADYGTTASFDGFSDGTVDTGWQWISNPQRVHYEETTSGHSRNLGTRSLAPTGTDCTSGTNPETFFLGEINYSGGGATCLLPGRGTALIVNPSFSVANGDIYGQGSIDSYFGGSSASSAFVFSNGYISNGGVLGGGGGLFPGYYNNPSSKADTTFDSGSDPITTVFKNFTNLFSSGVQGIGSTISGSFNLGQNSNRIYQTSGDLTLSGPVTFCNGSGTIYVNGNLYINGNGAAVTYCGGAYTKSQLPSVGFIVRGNIITSPSVQNIVGSYFATGDFCNGSVTESFSPGTPDQDCHTFYTPNNDRSSGDVPFNLNGLIVAGGFDLQRQLNGASRGENFVYDGRVVVAPPPGFTDLTKAPAVWNEGVPYN